MNLIRTLFLLFSHMSFCVLLAFHKLRTCFPLRKLFFDWIHFLTLRWRGLGLNFLTKIKVREKVWNTHKSTQFFMLIPNMIIVLSQIVTVLPKYVKYYWVSLKKTRNHDSEIVRSGVSQVAMFFWVWKIDIFVALEKMYRMRYTRKMTHSTFWDENCSKVKKTWR